MSIAEARSTSAYSWKHKGAILSASGRPAGFLTATQRSISKACILAGAPSFAGFAKGGMGLTCSDAHQRTVAHPSKSTVLELAHVYCTSHQSNFFAAPWYRAPCSAKQNLNFRSRLKLEALAASRSAALPNHVLAFPSSLTLHLPRGSPPPKGRSSLPPLEF